MSVYVPLDVEYASDDKIIEAGPMAELVYVRGLAFCKRTLNDGEITRAQLAVVAVGISSPLRHVRAARRCWAVAANRPRMAGGVLVKTECVGR